MEQLIHAELVLAGRPEYFCEESDNRHVQEKIRKQLQARKESGKEELGNHVNAGTLVSLQTIRRQNKDSPAIFGEKNNNNKWRTCHYIYEINN